MRAARGKTPACFLTEIEIFSYSVKVKVVVAVAQR